MRDILRWILHWLSGKEPVFMANYTLSADLELPVVAAIDLALSPSQDISLEL